MEAHVFVHERQEHVDRSGKKAVPECPTYAHRKMQKTGRRDGRGAFNGRILKEDAKWDISARKKLRGVRLQDGVKSTGRNTMSTKRNISANSEHVSIPTEEEIKRISKLADEMTRLNNAAINARASLCDLYKLMANLRIC